MIRIEMTEEQYELLVTALETASICPKTIGFSGYVRLCYFAANKCEQCIREALKPETIPDKGKEG